MKIWMIASAVISCAGFSVNALDSSNQSVNDRLRPHTDYYAAAGTSSRNEPTLLASAAPVQSTTTYSAAPAKKPAPAPAVAAVVESSPAPATVASIPSSGGIAESIAQRVDQMDVRRLQVDTVLAHLKVACRDNNTKREFQLNGVYLADKKGNMRFRLLYSETLVADLVFNGDQVEAWLPMKGKYVKGTRKDLLTAGPNDLALLARAGQARDLFFPRAWTDEARERRGGVSTGREIVKVQLTNGTEGKCLRKIYLSPAQAYADQMDLFTASGEALGNFRYSNYSASGNAPVHPNLIVMSPTPGSITLKLEVTEFNVNEGLPEKSFELTVPEDQSPVSLQQTLKEGKGIF